MRIGVPILPIDSQKPRFQVAANGSGFYVMDAFCSVKALAGLGSVEDQCRCSG